MNLALKKERVKRNKLPTLHYFLAVCCSTLNINVGSDQIGMLVKCIIY